MATNRRIEGLPIGPFRSKSKEVERAVIRLNVSRKELEKLN